MLQQDTGCEAKGARTKCCRDCSHCLHSQLKAYREKYFMKNANVGLGLKKKSRKCYFMTIMGSFGGFVSWSSLQDM